MKFRSRSSQLTMLKTWIKLFVTISLITFSMFIVLGIGGMIQAKMVTSPISSMNGLTANIASKHFLDMMALEVPHLKQGQEESTFSQKNIRDFLIQFVTNINPGDPRTLLAREMPGLGNEKTILLHKGAGQDQIALPMDFTPSKEALKDSTPSPVDIVPQESQDDSPSLDLSETESVEPPPSQSQATTRKKVFIYHSHNTESWVPELEGVTDISDAFDSKINITLLGKRLAERLEEEGIESLHSDKDYPSTVPDFNYSFSYKYSKKTVLEAIAANPDLEYFFDIHRDAQKRDLTTVTIDGVDYAQLYFIIGLKNEHWEDNEAFANEIHNRLEEKYPGISRGIFAKDGSSGHGEYNQSYSPHSLLIEIGGPENTLEESYRTTDVLAEVISEIFWEAEKVDHLGTEAQTVMK